MVVRGLRLLRVLGVGLGCLVVAGLAIAMPFVARWWKPNHETAEHREVGPRVKLADAKTLAVPPDVVKALGIQTTEVRKATRPRPLPPLTGSLAIDTNSLAHVHSRFAGEVIKIGELPDPDADVAPGQPTVIRPLRFGDKVTKNQLLAIVWSKDLGEKKSELIDALSRLRLDEETLQRLQEAHRNGAIPERSLREAERNVEAGRIAAARAERTLRSWRLTDGEIEAIKNEADQLRRNNTQANPKQEAEWARVEVRASLDGTILEKNVAPGDLVDTTTDLFKIGDLTRLSVWANVYEEDLPTILHLARPIHWTIAPKSNPHAAPLKGAVSQIGDIIDPNQHTALIIGQVDNTKGELRVGQLVTAIIDVPPPPDEVEIPTSALIEDGRDSIVFIQPDTSKPLYAIRRVSVARRYHDVVYVHSEPPAEEKSSESKNEEAKAEPLRPGEQVVTSGAIALRATLEDLQVANKNEAD